MENYITEGGRFGLRMMRYEDCANVVRWRNAVKSNYVYREELTIEGEQQYFRQKIEPGRVHILIICMKELNDKPIGCVVFNGLEEDGSSEYGLFIGESDARGQGVGRWAIASAMKYAFTTWGYNKITARIFTDNIASIKSNEAAGLHKTSKIIDVTCSDGEKKQMYGFEILP